MMRRLFYVVKYWTLLSGFISTFVSCNQGYREEVFSLDDRLVSHVIAISCYITGQQEELGGGGDTEEELFEKNFLEAHRLFPVVEKMLQEYPKITNYPIAQSTLKELNKALFKLKSDIDRLTDDQEKSQFTKEWAQLVSVTASKRDG